LAALLKLTFVFAGIVFLLGRKWNLGFVLLLASAAVGLLFAYPLPQVLRDTVLAAVDPLTLRLTVAVVLIMTLGELLRQTASTEGMVKALQALIPDGRVVVAALPALIGLLPMIGGAMFSAPMVDEVGDRLGINGERKTFINYWFRHIWEPAFPIYPSMMLGAALLGLSTLQMVRANWPLTASAALGGVLFGLVGLDRNEAQRPPATPRGQSLRTLAESIWPILLVIALSLTLSIDERLEQIGLILSIVVTIALAMAVKRISPRVLVTIFRERIPWETVVVIIGALIFRRVLENSSAMLAVSENLANLHIPATAVAFSAPFIAGLLTGLIAAAFSIGFPVALALVPTDGTTIAPEWIIWLMAGGFIGGMCSPVHLCLALTRVYFKAEWGPVYRLLVPPIILVVATTAGILALGSQ
jgi:integral membrane protein (TIGR00529 family)